MNKIVALIALCMVSFVGFCDKPYLTDAEMAIEKLQETNEKLDRIISSLMKMYEVNEKMDKNLMKMMKMAEKHQLSFVDPVIHSTEIYFR